MINQFIKNLFHRFLFSSLRYKTRKKWGGKVLRKQDNSK